MFLKIKLSEIFHNLQLRYFNTTSMSGRASKLVQFHSGGDDYCPSKECEGLGENIGGNPADGIILAWRDDVKRVSEEGEKRIYALAFDKETGKVKRDESTGEMIAAAEIHLKNDGQIIVNNSYDLNITVVGDCNLKAANTKVETMTATVNASESVNISTATANINATSSVNIVSPVTNIGDGGNAIARLGDEVEVEVESGSSAGTWKGKITSAGVNTSI